jgi:hypothetical protein
LLSESRRAEAQAGDGHARAAKPRELHSAQVLFGLDSRQAAVDRKIDASDVAALVRGEEQGEARRGHLPTAAGRLQLDTGERHSQGLVSLGLPLHLINSGIRH